jgi:hypothetical protein
MRSYAPRDSRARPRAGEYEGDTDATAAEPPHTAKPGVRATAADLRKTPATDRRTSNIKGLQIAAADRRRSLSCQVRNMT